MAWVRPGRPLVEVSEAEIGEEDSVIATVNEDRDEE